MLLSFIGLDALAVAGDANLQPELLLGDSWAPARSLAQARSMACAEPNTVRLIGDSRVLMENILKRSINADDDLSAFAQQALDAGLNSRSITLIKAQLT